MLKNLFITTVLLYAFNTVTAQENKTLKFDKNASLLFQESPITLSSKRLVSSYSFNKLVFKDLSHLLLGDSNLSEGIEASFDGNTSEISLSGTVYSGDNRLINVKGNFSATDNDIYFIDENNGSTNAKITLNYYRAFKGGRWYDSPITSDKSKRGFYKIEKAKQLEISNIIKDYYHTTVLLEKAGISVPTIDIANSDTKQCKVENCTNNNLYSFNNEIIKFGYSLYVKDIDINTINKDTAYITAKKLKGSPKNNKFVTNIIKSDDEKIKIPKTLDKEVSYDIDKVLALYEKTITAMDSITSKLIKIEETTAQPYWNSKKLSFFGVSPFYEREEIKNVFLENATVSFEDQFQNTSGDLFGIEGQVGYFYQAKKSTYKTKMFFTRATLNIGRGSNIKAFTSRTYTSTITDTINSQTITEPRERDGNFNINGNSYNFAFNLGLGGEVYWYPTERFGLFGLIGYNNLNFDNGKGKDIEIYNLRLGTLFNIKSKDKEFATLQLFADRSDLSLSPNGSDENLRFGFKIGLPFNFKNKL